MRIKMSLSYDGTNYCGWQIQNNGVAVQQVVADAIEKITGEKVTVTGSGRTDAGVHAECQVAHFDVKKATVPPKNYAKALNTVLPNDVRVIDSDLAQDDFNACRSAKKKTYRYSLYLSQTEQPLKERYATQIDKTLDILAMQTVAQVFVGEHDFKCFNASGGGAKTTVRTIYSIEIEKDGQDVKVYVTGNGFLYKMVRSLVGFLIAVGLGKATEEDALQMLNSGKRSQKGKTLQAKGLCLVKVEYE